MEWLAAAVSPVDAGAAKGPDPAEAGVGATTKVWSGDGSASVWPSVLAHPASATSSAAAAAVNVIPRLICTAALRP